MEAVVVVNVPEDMIGKIAIVEVTYHGEDVYFRGVVRPLPKIKTREEEIAKDPFIDDLFYDEFILGYNTCLNEIAGGTE